VQQVDVQGVAFDPFAAVEQPAQRMDFGSDLDAKRLLERVAGAHLVGDRADAADAGGDVGDFTDLPPAEEAFKEARRLVDVELDVLDVVAVHADVEPAFPFDAGQGFDFECAGSRHEPAGESIVVRGLKVRTERLGAEKLRT